MSVGSVLPWFRGSTRSLGYLDWTGLHDTGEGAMLIGAAIGLAVFVRLRGTLEEIGPRARFIPMVIALAGGLLWVVAFRKLLQLSWFELDVGGRPQVGVLMAGLGILVAFAGSLLAATDPESVAAARARAEAERRESGAGGGVGAASSRARRGGESPPGRDEYSVVSRVDRLRRRDDDADDDGPARG